MQHVSLPGSGVRLSRLVLGGHEYLADGQSRGFNEDFAKAVMPGHIFPGFGGESRRSVLRAAYDLGIDTFDVTLDSEKEALGRNFAELPPPYEVHIQTRPEGMVYGYDPANRKMASLSLLRGEVERCLRLLRRERIDLLNLGILKDAVDGDPEFLAKLSTNIAALKQEGLIGHACADTFSGEATYLAMIRSGAFAALNVNFNIADDGASRNVFAAARSAGMRVIAREAFLKGELFRLGRQENLDGAVLARAALKSILAHPDIDAVIVGAGTAEQLIANASALDGQDMTEAESGALATLRGNSIFRAYRERKLGDFCG